MATKDEKQNDTNDSVNKPDDDGPRNTTGYTTLSAQVEREEDLDKCLEYLREEHLTVTERIQRAKEVEHREALRDGGPRQPVLEEINMIRQKYAGQY